MRYRQRMTERVRVEHDFECSENGFWETFLNADYNREMFQSHMKFPRWDLIRCEEEKGGISRVVEVEPYVAELPGPIKKVLGDTIRYREEGHLDRTKNCYELRVIPSRLADKILVSGRQFTEPLPGGRCRRIFEATVEVKVFGIGGMIERNIAGDLRKSYDIGARFTQNYMSRHNIT